MALVKAQVTLPRDTLIPADISTNTFHFRTPADVVAVPERDAIMSALSGFYGTIGTLLSPALNPPFTVKLYRALDPKPRVPIHTATINPTIATSGPNMPEEVAIVMSFHGAAASGQPQARRRGRIYIGPLAGGVTLDALKRARPPLANRETIAGAGNTLRTFPALVTAAVEWVVYSPTAQASFPVVNGWVDDAYDTVRSRGPGATARTPFAV